ncbi:MAG: FAD-dependent oxidoreductase [Pseudomonadales bacterium]
MNVDYDVIVVGSGAAGLAAAVAAADSGASVLIVEADTQVGGSSRLSGGHFYAAGTSVQREAGELNDSADAMYEHYLTLNQWLVEPAVVRRYCDLSAPTFEWLKDLGVNFPVDQLYASGVGSTRRGHPPEGGGEVVVQVLDAHRSKRQVDLVLDARVTKLVKDKDGAVCGVRIGQDEASAHAVILSTGGFGANPELLQKHYPEAAAAGNWSWYIGSPKAQGDGLTLGTEVGAVLDGHNRGLLLVSPGFSRDLEVLLPPWLILVNAQGRRFTSETAPYTVLGGLISHQDGPVYAIFDEGARLAAKPSPISQAYWVTDVLGDKAADGTVAQANSLDELAQRIDVSAVGLAGTIEHYNADCAKGADSAYFKSPASGMRPLVEAPFYAAEVRPAIVCWTGTGLRINADTCVVKENGSPVPGLYAAGETVGSLHGDRYIGGGGSFGPCVVFGKLAGEGAAAYARERAGSTGNV